jgi:hypothetical protein
MTKNEYHQLIVSQLNEKNFETSDIDIWVNPNFGSFRLNELGYKLFKNVSGLPHHQMTLKISNWKLLTVLALDRKLSSPFFYELNAKKTLLDLTMFGDNQEFFWLALYNDLECFLKNYQKNT